jgi:hypothetical protein
MFLQYLLGLDALGHDVFLLDVERSTGNDGRDQQVISSFFERLRRYGFDDRSALLMFDKEADRQALGLAQMYGKSRGEIKEIAESADLLWSFGGCIGQPLLSLFRRRVYLDLDPGHLHVSALTWDLGLHDYHVFFSVGGKLGDPDCEVPTLGLTWYPFTPFVYLPMWDIAPDPGPQAPFSSVTHWNWGELWLQDRVLSWSKRDAYLRYVELPQRTGRPFELAVWIHPEDQTSDRELLQSYGWKLVDPWEVARSPSSYKVYIQRSRAEILCPKPIFRELKTGWFSDRSVCYLASGRPVLAEDTGFSDYLPTGSGLVVFHDLEEAIAGVADIDGNYENHMRAARALAEEFFDSRRCLDAILSVCG